MWKPGQLVTIEGKVYRVKKLPKGSDQCLGCPSARIPEDNNPCRTCLCTWKVGPNCRLEEIKPRTQARNRS